MSYQRTRRQKRDGRRAFLTAADDDRKLRSAFEPTKAADTAANEGEAPTTILNEKFKMHKCKQFYLHTREEG